MLRGSNGPIVVELFRDLVAMVGITTQLYGSERLKLYAAEKKWTNVEFDSIGMHSVQPRASLNCARS